MLGWGIDADDVFGAVVVVGPCLRFSRLIDFFDFCPVLAVLLLREDDDDREPPSRDRGTLDNRLEVVAREERVRGEWINRDGDQDVGGP